MQFAVQRGLKSTPLLPRWLARVPLLKLDFILGVHTMSDQPNPVPSSAPSPETLKAAYKAFKKRLKIQQLDADSRVGRSPMSGGHTQIAGIVPPDQYPRAVWDALVAEGKLVNAGSGMYGLR